LLHRYLGKGYRNATGRSAVETKKIFGAKEGTYHWDDALDQAGNLAGHGVNNPHGEMPHVQLYTDKHHITIFYED
jgi:hypothetical protein